jgi:hypothetical protein
MAGGWCRDLIDISTTHNKRTQARVEARRLETLKVHTQWCTPPHQVPQPPQTAPLTGDQVFSIHEPVCVGGCCFYSNHHSSVPRCQLSPLAHPAPNKCELNCIPKGQNFYYKHKDAVVDGTPCEPGQRDICVDGVCRVSAAPSQLAGGLLWVMSSSISGTKWLSGVWWLKS